jgi:(p)ppGpp synthase/HD superfamily hydrolase
MIYTEKVKLACHIMFETHKDDKDKGGYPYVFHPFYLATQMDDEESTCVALLHDVIEDHRDLYSIDDLEKLGFGDRIIEAIRLLTHSKDVPYLDYIAKIKNNSIAKKVKIADLKHNLDSTRLGGTLSPKSDIYSIALKLLEN